MEMKLMEAVQQHAQENDIDLDKLAEETESVEETQDEVQDSKTV